MTAWPPGPGSGSGIAPEDRPHAWAHVLPDLPPPTVNTESSVSLDAVAKTYGTGPSAVVALRDLTLSFARGPFTAVMGPSGSGKSTFLHVAAGLDQPTAGTVRLARVDLAEPGGSGG